MKEYLFQNNFHIPDVYYLLTKILVFFEIVVELTKVRNNFLSG